MKTSATSSRNVGLVGSGAEGLDEWACDSNAYDNVLHMLEFQYTHNFPFRHEFAWNNII
jgi:hypothetical protein